MNELYISKKAARSPDMAWPIRNRLCEMDFISMIESSGACFGTWVEDLSTPLIVCL